MGDTTEEKNDTDRERTRWRGGAKKKDVHRTERLYQLGQHLYTTVYSNRRTFSSISSVENSHPVWMNTSGKISVHTTASMKKNPYKFYTSSCPSREGLRRTAKPGEGKSSSLGYHQMRSPLSNSSTPETDLIPSFSPCCYPTRKSVEQTLQRTKS